MITPQGRLAGCTLLVLAVASCAAAARPATYNTAAGPVDGKLNVHIVCHTHDDVGWLKTIDEYYMGSNQTIQHAMVQFIISNVVDQLAKDPNRRFSYAEQAFFQRWWREQAADVRKQVQGLVKSGQLELINGGWSMHDEGALHYVAAIDQTTLGHRFIHDEFDGYTPRAQWAIDPFGHSSFNAYFSAESGFDGLFFARADYQDKAARAAARELEMMWQPSPSQHTPGTAPQLFTSIFQGAYTPWPGYCFDSQCNDPPVQDDPRLEGYNVQDRVDGFVKAALAQAQSFATNHSLFLAGSDFLHENSLTWYRNLDRMIHYVNADGRINAFYSTPSTYIDAVHATNRTWTTKTDDFFPYAIAPHAFLTGYYTSRPALKRYTRLNSAYLGAARQLDGLVLKGNGSSLESLAEAVGVAQHHDAITGTAKQHVAFDYARRLARGHADAAAVVNEALATWAVSHGFDGGGGDAHTGAVAFASSASASTTTTTPTLQVVQCPLSNVSVCPASSTGKPTTVLVYNPLSRRRTEFVRVPVASEIVAVTNASGSAVPSQVTPVTGAHTAGAANAAPYTAVFRADLPALGLATFHMSPVTSEADLGQRGDHGGAEGAGPASSRRGTAAAASRAAEVAADQTMSNDLVSVTFDGTTGRLSSVTDKESGTTVAVNLDFVWYNASASGPGWGDTATPQNDGAYIFRPNSSTPVPCADGPITTTISDGPLVHEAAQSHSAWVNVTVRLYDGSPDVEIEWTVGPVPIEDGLGKDVVARYATDLATNKTWYTDSNGRELMQRRVDYRPTWKLQQTEDVAGNYFPVSSALVMRDQARSVAVLTDRSQGGGMVVDGAAELMVHRRLLYCEQQGWVGEPLNETTGITPYPTPTRVGTGLVVTGKHTLQVRPVAGAAAAYRPAMDALFADTVVAYSTSAQPRVHDDSTSMWAPSELGADAAASLLAAPLPASVRLMTVEGRPPGSDCSACGGDLGLGSRALLLRFSHQFAAGEDAQLSRPVTLSLRGMFADGVIGNIVSVTELGLTANQPRSSISRLLWRTSADPDPKPPVVPPAPVAPDFTFTLEPLAFRTFHVELSS